MLTQVSLELPWNFSQDGQAVEWCVCVIINLMFKIHKIVELFFADESTISQMQVRLFSPLHFVVNFLLS